MGQVLEVLPFGNQIATFGLTGADLLAALELLGQPATGWLDDEAVVVAKHFWKDAPPERVGSLVRRRDRRFGETALSVYRRDPEHAAGGR